MAVVLRLSRAGTHKAPFYHVVATDSRNPRDGKYLEDVGTYDPTVAHRCQRVDGANQPTDLDFGQGTNIHCCSLMHSTSRLS